MLPEQRARRFRLGLLALAAGGLFVLLLGFVLEGTFGSERVHYFIIFEENVKGMVVGSKVNFQGVPVGVVCDMRFQNGKTLVELSVDPTRASIQDITRARMDRLLVTGQVTIELEGYGEQGQALPPGAMIEPKKDPLSSLRGTIPDFVDRAAGALTRLDRVLANAELVLDRDNRQNLALTLQNFTAASTDLAATSANLAAASAHLRERTLPAVDDMLADVRRLAGDGGAMAAKASAALTRLEPALLGLVADAGVLTREATALTNGLRAPAQTSLASFRQALEDVRALARQLKLAPNSLLFGVERGAAPIGGRE
ncbi:MAG: MlaD family protein [bacterium]|nr:MlaD family protein [bacterium]